MQITKTLNNIPVWEKEKGEKKKRKKKNRKKKNKTILTVQCRHNTVAQIVSEKTNSVPELA